MPTKDAEKLAQQIEVLVEKMGIYVKINRVNRSTKEVIGLQAKELINLKTDDPADLKVEGLFHNKSIQEIHHQVVSDLEKDHTTRQSIVLLEPINCANCLHFLIRNDLLYLIVYMRSSDVEKLPFDIDVFIHLLKKVFKTMSRKRLSMMRDHPRGYLIINFGSVHSYVD